MNGSFRGRRGGGEAGEKWMLFGDAFTFDAFGDIITRHSSVLYGRRYYVEARGGNLWWHGVGAGDGFVLGMSNVRK